MCHVVSDVLLNIVECAMLSVMFLKNNFLLNYLPFDRKVKLNSVISGKWQRKDQPNGVPSQNLPANG